MQNSTQRYTAEEIAAFHAYILSSNSIYLSGGILITIMNCLLLAAMTKTLCQRRHMLLTEGIAVSQLLIGVSYIYLALYRYVIISFEIGELERWKCFFFGWYTFGFKLGETESVLLFLFLAIDRFVSITFFRLPSKITAKLTQHIILVTNAINLIFVLSVALYRIFKYDTKISPFCSVSNLLSENYSHFQDIALVVIMYISVALYLFTFCSVLVKLNTSMSEVRRWNIKREKSVLKRLSIILVAIVVSKAIPSTIFTVMTKSVSAQARMIMWMVDPITLSVNLWLYCLMESEIRKRIIQAYVTIGAHFQKFYTQIKEPLRPVGCKICRSKIHTSNTG
ncbi:hypothetical protein T4D_3235 [Trichinella pseudospiralis]|uniref:G-protein coupled receptors family 1 profile domain-containing protein n=1 Tax=Trichinella pseudospiralis TaxID=6337 RepID=A0A0V1FW47_TRIPS|nr:hypothetical protein T4D_3235 [Trichinella pseudospiralis]